MSKALDLNKENFEQEVLKSDIPVLVDFWATWCMPCRMLAPTLDDLAKEMEGKLKVVKINTEETANQELASQYEIQSIPNMKLFKDGEVVAEFIGLKNKESLKKEIEEALNK